MRALRTASLLAVAVACACGGRPDAWNASPSGLSAYGLTNAAIVIDDPTHRAVALVPHAGQTLDRLALPVGHGVLAATVSPDQKRLFVLSAGDVPRKSDSDQYPSLTVIDGSTLPPTATRYDMSEPLSGLAIDPEGHWAAAYADQGKSTSFVQNPNEIVLFDLTKPPSDGTNPISRTLRSFGGTPQRLTFTPTLHLPAGPRRLLVVETDRDVSILDLDHAADTPPRPEITVRLTNGTDTRQLVPAGIAVDDGDPKRTDDSRIAIRTSNDSNVFTLQLGPAPAGTAPGANDFLPTINLTDVGAIPSDVAFVQTDGGLRVAALVPTTSNAVLIEPDTSLTETVSLPAPYGRMSIVTGATGGPTGGPDVALLWNASAAQAGVAFWTLGQTTGQPYRSVEVLGIGDDVTGVLGVPQPNGQLEVLETNGSSFYVLDLGTRTAAPLETLGGASLVVAPDGGRVWAFAPNTSQLADLDLATLHPVPLYVDRPIDDVFDVARDDGGRALIALHGQGTVGATVFDALAPDTAHARSYSALLMEGL